MPLAREALGAARVPALNRDGSGQSISGIIGRLCFAGGWPNPRPAHWVAGFHGTNSISPSEFAYGASVSAQKPRYPPVREGMERALTRRNESPACELFPTIRRCSFRVIVPSNGFGTCMNKFLTEQRVRIRRLLEEPAPHTNSFPQSVAVPCRAARRHTGVKTPGPHVAPRVAMIAPDFALLRVLARSLQRGARGGYPSQKRVHSPAYGGGSMCAQKGKRQARARPARFVPGTTFENMNAAKQKPTQFVNSMSGLVQYAG